MSAIEEELTQQPAQRRAQGELDPTLFVVEPRSLLEPLSSEYQAHSLNLA